MKCQACGQQTAAVLLNIHVNGQKSEKHLCHACYKNEEIAAPSCLLGADGYTYA